MNIAMFEWWLHMMDIMNPGAANATRYLTYDLPGVGDITKMENAWRQLQDYMNTYSFDWKDMWNTGNIPGAGQFGTSATRFLPNAKNFVSKNIADLYSDRSPGKPMRPRRNMSPELLMELQYGQRW